MNRKHAPENPERNTFPKNVSVSEDEFVILRRIIQYTIECMPLHEHEYQSLKSFLRKMNHRGQA